MITESECIALQLWADHHMGERNAEILMRARGLPYRQGLSSPVVHLGPEARTVTEDERASLQQWADTHMNEEVAQGLTHHLGLSYRPHGATEPVG